MIFIATYTPICGSEYNKLRFVLGTLFIAIGYFTFPFLEIDVKEKFLLSFSKHLIISTIIFIALYWGVIYFLKLNKGSWYGDLIFCISGFAIFSYFIYTLFLVLNVLSELMQKVRIIIFPKIEGDVKGLKSIIESITAWMVTITTLVGSIAGLISLLRSLSRIGQ